MKLLTAPLFAGILALPLFTSSCVTEFVDPGFQKHAASSQFKNHKWRLSEMPIRPGWKESEKSIPFLLAPYPDYAPAQFRLSHLPEVRDQRPQASGTAWALGYFGTTYLFRIKKGVHDYTCSPAFVYNQLNRGKDAGVDFIEALDLLKDEGCSSMDYMPYRSFDYTYKPGVEAFASASHFRIQGYGRVDFTDVQQIKSMLLQDSPVIVLLQVYDNFVTLDRFHWKRPVGRTRGLHALVVVGYDDKDEYFIVQNSVGSEWGEKGRAAIPYSWFIRVVKRAYVIW